MDKDYTGWNIFKQELDNSDTLPSFEERQVWWCSVGMNVGFEIFGKGKTFTRPVLILTKYSEFTFFGLPLSTTCKKNSPYYFPIEIKQKSGSVLLSQGRMFDSKRLTSKLIKISESKFDEVKQAFMDSL